MFVRVHGQHQEWEMVKWILLLVAAGALTLAWASQMAGAAEFRPPDREPAILPSEIQEWASPMDDAAQPAEVRDISMEVWQAIDLQYSERYDEAITAWSRLQMPCETEAWKHVALGQAYLANGEVQAALESLTAARRLEPDNPVVHYYFGILRLVQSAVAEEWYDAVEPGGTRLIAHAPPDIAPNTRSMYKLAAITELEKAIEHAVDLPSDQALVPAGWSTRAAMEPTVHDLLLAIKANNLVAKSHNMLGSLYLERGSLEVAESHMDEAVAGGLNVLDGYTALGEKYQSEGRHTDAMRAHLKAAQQEPGKMAPLRKAWDNLRESIW